MSSRSTSKRKENAKGSNLYKSDINDEVKAELEAMSGLEYNLHGDKVTDIDSFPLSHRKSRLQPIKESNKMNDKITMESDKLPSVKEKIDVESSIPYLSSSVSKKELRNVIEQAGNTSEDRYKILEARDRLMRLRQRKIHTLETAKATVGTCPDMCPEKERLMREFQRQVASYELLDGSEYKINHDTAVKQYSRSSADQEEPMPQDLRPVSSLKMTMSYLLHEIVDLCQEEGTNLGEWYHFLWDRTRGIRKDITQQELCCVDTVELVEECARFHIVCSERLCAEELSVFDKKINTENLTKCLQTLKYMYHDLRVKGINCKNEPEFRAYIILLNLNDANFMWDLQRLPTCIQKSSEVNFALRIYSAIQSNNYTKFFKLIKNTTYLNACLLLRYFFQIRVQALNIMVKAYCRTTSNAYPLYEFMDILAFEDENEAIYFCEQAGLNVSDDEMHIILNRQNIILPPATSDQGRAKNIVESKRIAMGYTIGQAIAGGKLPEQFYINHKPHNSFHSNGYLKSEAINASDQSGNNGDIIDIDEDQEEPDPYEYMDEDMPDESPETYISRTVRRKKSLIFVIPSVDDIDNKETTNVTSNIFATSVFSKQKNTSKSGENVKFSFASAFNTPTTSELSTATDDTGKIIISKVDSANSTIADSASNEKPILFGDMGHQTNNIFAQRKSSGMPENVFNFSTNVTTTSSETSASIFSQSSKAPKFPTSTGKTPFSVNVNDINDFFIPKPMASPKIKLPVEDNIEEKEDYVRNIIEESAVEATEEIENEVIDDVCSTILKQEIEKKNICDRLCKKIYDDMLKDVTRETCQNILKTEMLTKKKIEDISNRIKNRLVLKYYIIWSRRVQTRKQQRMALENTPVWLPACSLSECANNLYKKEQNLVIQNMRSKRKIDIDYENDQRNYLVPVEVQIYNGIKQNAKRLDIELSSIMYWKMIISWPNLHEKFLLGRYKKIICEYFSPRDFTMDPIIKTYKPNPYETLNICIKHMDEQIDDNNSVGADGLFFIATTDENPKSVAKRLTKTILSRQKLMRIPLVLLILGDETLHNRIKPTEAIQKLIDTGYISDYVVHCEAKVDESIILRLSQTTIDWLTRHKSSAQPLEMNSLSELINSCLCDELWLRISGHASFNVNLLMALRNPQFVIDMHNEAVAHLIDIINDPESLMYTDFPPEFKQFLPMKFTLPCTYEYFDEDWKSKENRENIERILRSFSLPPWPFDWPINNTVELHRWIVEYCESTLVNSNYSRMSNNILSNVFYMSDENETPNCAHVILEISKERLRDIDNIICVVYNKNHIKHFQTLPWWFESDTFVNFKADIKSLTMQESDYQLDDEPAEKKRRIAKENAELPHIISKYSFYGDDNPENSIMEQSHVDDIFNISQQFEKTLSQQLLSNSDFEKKLESALHKVDMNT